MGFKAIAHSIAAVTQEIARIFPDGFIVATGLFALLTLSFPFAVFFGSQLEALVIFFVARLVTHSLGITQDSTHAGRASSPECRTGFISRGLDGLTVFSAPGNSPFPSAPMYTLAFTAVYAFMTLNSQFRELSTLGEKFTSKYYFSLASIVAILFIYFIFRLNRGCESFGVLLTSLTLGGIVGTLLVSQNRALFSESSINLLGIPILRSRAADGKPLYICATGSSV